MGRVCNRAGGAYLTGDVCHQSESVTVEVLGCGTLSGHPAALGIGDGLALTAVGFLLCDVIVDHDVFLSS